MFRACPFVLVLGCVSQSSPRDPAEKCGEPVRGDRSQMTTPIAAVHAELAAHDVSNSFGVSVRGISCSVPE